MTPVATTYKPAVVPAGTTGVVIVATTTVNPAAVVVPAVMAVLIVHPHEAEADVNVLGQ